MKNTIFLLLCISFLFAGCKGKDIPKEALSPQPQDTVTSESKEAQSTPAAPESAKINQPPRVIAIDALPLYPKIGDTIKVTVKAEDPDGDRVDLNYQWFRNDETLSETTENLTLTSDFKRGDNISLHVIPTDRKTKGSMGILKVTIANAPPEIKSSPNDIKFINRKFTYQVKATDPEGDPIAYSLKTSPTGMIINQNTGLVQWDVPAGFKGRASIMVNATDDHGGESAQSFVFEITP